MDVFVLYMLLEVLNLFYSIDIYIEGKKIVETLVIGVENILPHKHGWTWENASNKWSLTFVHVLELSFVNVSLFFSSFSMAHVSSIHMCMCKLEPFCPIHHFCCKQFF
jgi:hypothetical protein